MTIKYKIIDNFLNDSEFTELTNVVLPITTNLPKVVSNFGWNYICSQVTGDDEGNRFKTLTKIPLLNSVNNWYLSHSLQYQSYYSEALQYFAPLLSKLNPLAFYRIQANLTVQQNTRMRSLFHRDHGGKTDMLTSIYYMNTTNGPTLLEDGTEIECRANRLVTFPEETFHSGVMCTDSPYRIVVNFNYFKDMNAPERLGKPLLMHEMVHESLS
jgi:hypothetical protein